MDDALPDARLVALLSTASHAVLDASLDLDAILVRVTDVVASQLGDGCTIRLLNDDHTILEVAATRQAEGAADPVRTQVPPRPADREPYANVLRRGDALVRDHVAGGEFPELGATGRSICVVALRSRDGNIGTLSVQRAPSRPGFSRAEVWVLQQVADLAAQAVTNARLHQRLLEGLRGTALTAARLDALLQHAPIGFAFWDPDLRFMHLNEPLAAMNGRPLAEHLGRRIDEVIPELWPTLQPVFDELRATRRPILDIELTGVTGASGGEERNWLASYHPVLDADGEFAGVSAVVVDITERIRTEREARLLGSVGELAAAGLDLENVIERAACLAVPEFADVGLVVTTSADGHVQRAVAAETDERGERATRELAVHGGTDTLVHTAFDARTTLVVEDPAEPLFDDVVTSSAIVVPMKVRGRVSAALAVGKLRGHFRADDVRVAEDLAGRVAQILENAELAGTAALGPARLRLLAAAGTLVESELDIAVRADRIVNLVVPDFADCALVFLDADGQMRLVAAAHVDAEVNRALLAVDWPDLDPGAATGVTRAIEEGAPIRQAPRQGRMIGRRREDDAAVDLTELTGIRDAMVVPMMAADGTIGVLVFAYGRSGRRYHGEDEALANELARIAAPAITNAQRYEQERGIAESLQRSLLPQELPDVAGVRVAARYLPGTAGLHVGGDWYDVLSPENGRVLLVIGDVVGHGIDAAINMGRFRTAVQFSARRTVDPGEVLAAVDGFMGQAYPDQMATLLVVAYEPATGLLHAASAGHLPPLLVAPDGTAQFVPVVPGPPICVADETAPEVASLTVPAGTRLVLFTDGLVERRGEGIDEGLARLRQIAGRPSSPSEDLARDLVEALVPPGGPADDVAFLVAHLGVAGPMLDLWVEADTAQLSLARRAVKAWLAAAAHPDADDLLLATNEAIANALEHAYTDGERRPVRVRGRLDDGFRLEVTDRGQWRDARDDDDGRGRGISIMRALMDDVTIETTAAGTTVVLQRAGTRTRPPAGGLVPGR